jgi:FkbM family methyltransferase
MRHEGAPIAGSPPFAFAFRNIEHRERASAEADAQSRRFLTDVSLPGFDHLCVERISGQHAFPSRRRAPRPQRRIGANVGVFTLYAAARGDIDVWAFEPAAVNYYNLVANCELNRLEQGVRCLQLGFSGVSGLADLHVSQLKSAHSFSFKESRKPRKDNLSLQAVQLSTIDEFIADNNVACPNYIKIDVPGLTHEIFAGAEHTLAQPALREIQVEAPEHGGGRLIAERLAPLGFKLVKRGMRPGGIQRDLVFARDVSAANRSLAERRRQANGTAPVAFVAAQSGVPDNSAAA